MNRRWEESIVNKFKSLLMAASYETKPVEQIFREIDAVLLSLATDAAEAQVAAPLQALAPASEVDRQRAADIDGHFRDLMMRCELML